MNELTEGEFTPVNLMERRSNNVLVIMYWLRLNNTIHINLIDEQSGEYDYFPVPNDRALDAFHHPYFYQSLQDNKARV